MIIIENYDLVMGRDKLTEQDFIEGVLDRAREMSGSSQVVLMFHGNRNGDSAYREVYFTEQGTSFSVNYSGYPIPIILCRQPNQDSGPTISLIEKLLGEKIKLVK